MDVRCAMCRLWHCCLLCLCVSVVNSSLNVNYWLGNRERARESERTALLGIYPSIYNAFTHKMNSLAFYSSLLSLTRSHPTIVSPEAKRKVIRPRIKLHEISLWCELTQRTHTEGEKEMENGRASGVSERKRAVFAFMNLPFGYVGPYQRTKGKTNAIADNKIK